MAMSDDLSIDSASYTKKQMGDACEMLVAAELTLKGMPALKVADNWPHYDVIAQPPGKEPQRISVKSRTFKRGAAFVSYHHPDKFEWLAIVLLPGDAETKRRFFLIPRELADETARRNDPTTASALGRYYRIDEVPKIFAAFEDNFRLDHKRDKWEAIIKEFGRQTKVTGTATASIVAPLGASVPPGQSG
jgi:hypothetical protein